ncbi:MAG: hypothetical protein NTU61_05870 [Candidatus Altiarchaeota archaeon]|nr:hypothetical protein [Candidatus Altiarchaeota archaeon]
MRNAFVGLSLLLLLSSIVSAWGPSTHGIICREVVSRVWGSEGLKCLSNTGLDYCSDIKAAYGEEAYAGCVKKVSDGSGIDPAGYPEFVVNDVENHYDYANCPVKWLRDNQWICSGEGSPAREQTNYWLNAAENAESLCSRVERFCTGGNYYADSMFPLYRVKYLEGCLGPPFTQEVDLKVSSGEANWTVKKQCVFSYLRELAGVNKTTKSHVTFIVNKGDVDSIVDEMKAVASEVASREYYSPISQDAVDESFIVVSLVGPVNNISITSPIEQQVENTSTGEEGCCTMEDLGFEEGGFEEGMAEFERNLNETLGSFSGTFEMPDTKFIEVGDYRSKLNNALLVFVVGMLVACMIFLGYVLAHMRNVEERGKALSSAEKRPEPLQEIRSVPGPARVQEMPAAPKTEEPTPKKRGRKGKKEVT